MLPLPPRPPRPPHATVTGSLEESLRSAFSQSAMRTLPTFDASAALGGGGGGNSSHGGFMPDNGGVVAALAAYGPGED
jgi:hypothetical protein